MMKLVIKQADGCEIGAPSRRRVVEEIHFIRRGNSEHSSYEILQTPVLIDGGISIVLEAAYTPTNRVLSIIASYRIGAHEARFFSAVTEFGCIPTSFCACLPGGQCIEFYIDGTTLNVP